MSKTLRLLELMELVKRKRSFTVQELADELRVSYRTMWRYLQELSTLGVALYSVPGSNGGYRILKKETSENLVEVIWKPKTTYIGYCFDAPYIAKAETEILAPRLWLQLLSKLKELEGMKLPLQKVALSQFRKDEFTYFITVEASEVGKIPNGMTAVSIPEMYYAKKTHDHSLELQEVIQTYEDIFKWISYQGWERQESAFHLESYGDQFKPGVQQNKFDIYVPIQKKGKIGVNEKNK